MYKAIFFDIDGTLLDTTNFAEIARRGAIDVMIEYGLPSTQNETYKLLKEIIAEKGSNYGKHFNILTERICGKENPLLIAAGISTYHNIKFSLLRPFSKTVETLIYLKNKGYKLGIISNGLTIKQWEKLIRLGIHEFFDEIITSEEVGYEKPNKEIFEEAMERMKSKPENSIMVGNKFETDILGAMNTEMPSILVNSNFDIKISDEILENYDIRIIDTIKELRNVL
jgi:putative hydrolase of the HAD superfamily